MKITPEQHVFDGIHTIFPYDQNCFVLKNKQNIHKTKQMMFKWFSKAEGQLQQKKPNNPTNPSKFLQLNWKQQKC